MEQSKKNRIFAVLVLTAIIMLFSLPCFRSGVYKGHDLLFHLGRIETIAQGLKEGQFPVRYDSDAFGGYGYITSTMYPSLFMYIPAVLRLLGMPLYLAYNIYVLIINIATVIVSYVCSKRIFKSVNYGLLATILYTMSAWRFSNVYRRAALGEYTAMVFIPLLIYGLYVIYKEQSDKPLIKRIAPLVAAGFGIIQSHVLTTEIVGVFVFIFAILNIKSTMAVLKELLSSLAIVLLASAAFIVPFVDIYSTEKMFVNTNSEWIVDGRGLYFNQFLKLFSEGRGWDYYWSADDEGFLALGIAVVLCIAITIIWFLIPKNKEERENNKLIFTVFILGLIAMYVSSIYFPWKYITTENFLGKMMITLEFPWRLLVVQTVCFVLTGVYALQSLGEKFGNKLKTDRLAFVIRLLPIALALVIAVMQAGVFYFYLTRANETIRDDSVVASWPDLDRMYLLEGVDNNSLSDTNEPVFEGNKVTIPVFAYKNVIVKNANGDIIDWSTSDNKRIVIDRADYNDGLTIGYKIPALWRVSEVISLITIIGFISFYFKRRNA